MIASTLGKHPDWHTSRLCMSQSQQSFQLVSANNSWLSASSHEPSSLPASQALPVVLLVPTFSLFAFLAAICSYWCLWYTHMLILSHAYTLLLSATREFMDKLCKDHSPLVKLPALITLAPVLLSLPPEEALAPKPPLLSQYASLAKPPAILQATAATAAHHHRQRRYTSSPLDIQDMLQGWSPDKEGRFDLPLVCASYLGQV